MLNFAALPTEDRMSVGNQIIQFNVRSALPPGHETADTIAWTGKDGIIEYNDRLRLLEPFLDLAPYIGLVRAWLWAAEEGLSLDQAKLVMRDFIDALYISKRQLPYGGYTAKDDDIFYNTARLVAGGSSGIVPEINARIDVINARITDINNGIVAVTNARITDINNGIVAVTNGRIGEINGRFDSTCYWMNLRPQSNTFRSIYAGRVGAAAGAATDINPHQGFYGAHTANTGGATALWYYTAEAYSPGLGWNAFPRDVSPQYDAVSLAHLAADLSNIIANLSYIAADLTHISGGTGDTVPWETTTGQIDTLSYDAANALLRNILNRSRDLLSIKAAKINAMLTLTTLPAVINFDVTGGW